MPDDVPDDDWAADEGSEAEDPASAHDDIMQRLLNYQRSLREGAAPDEAAEAAGPMPPEPPTESPASPSGLVDLSSPVPAVEVEAESEIEPEDVGTAIPVVGGVRPGTAVERSEVEPDLSTSPVVTEPSLVMIPETSRRTAPATGASRADLEERLTSLEGRLERLGSKLGDLRRSFQDMAIAADERLAAMEEEVGRHSGGTDEPRSPTA